MYQYICFFNWHSTQPRINSKIYLNNFVECAMFLVWSNHLMSTTLPLLALNSETKGTLSTLKHAHRLTTHPNPWDVHSFNKKSAVVVLVPVSCFFPDAETHKHTHNKQSWLYTWPCCEKRNQWVFGKQRSVSYYLKTQSHYYLGRVIANEVHVPFVPSPCLKITKNDWPTPHWSLFDVNFGWFDRQHQLPPANHLGHVDRKEINNKNTASTSRLLLHPSSSPSYFVQPSLQTAVNSRFDIQIMHLEKQIATIFPLTQQIPPTKKKRQPFVSQKKTNTFLSDSFSRKLPLSHFLTNVGSGSHHSKSLPAMHHSFSLENHLLRQWQIHGTGIYSGLHEWLIFMVHVGTLKATKISIHIPPNGKTKNLQTYFGIGNMFFFHSSG